MNSCSEKPDGLSESDLIKLIEETITNNPKGVKSKFSGFTGGMDKLVVLEIKVSNIRYHGKGKLHGKDVWTIKFDAKGTLVASGDRGGVFDFEFDHRTQVSKNGEAWSLKF
jgi:hypothetical protein